MLIRIADRYILFEAIDTRSPPMVHLAWDDRLSAFRALRWLGPGALQPARTTAGLNHPNVVTVHEFGEHEGKAYVVVELLAGGSLSQRIADGGPLPPKVASKVADHVLRGLSAGHAQGMVHGGLQPSRVLLEIDGTAKVTDFGATRTLLDASIFASPEQRVSPSGVGPAADLYAVGKLLATMLLGPLPSDLGASEDDDTATETVLTDVDAGLAQVIRKATAFRPENRYESADQMRAALAEAREALSADPARPPLVLDSRRSRARQWRKDRSQLLARRPEEVRRPPSALERALSLAAVVVLPSGLGCFGLAVIISLVLALTRCLQ
ncbi:MAG: serine/threonine protein kinase [Myxococcales bacterium]|nr:serine/threonine protein kinase [Myxococcales bacterium]